MIRKDLFTGEPFVPKRINQRFANSFNRISYYNKKANELRHSAAFINKPLHINLRILNELMVGENEKIFFKQYLLGKGFSFNVHNNVKKHDGKNHYAVYDYVIITLTNEQIKIIKK
ncbi:hypothetical protein [Flavobacterium sp.]|jgi:hypothetical protein|uniref:hypothetical protein n=1 Tax=Flavobacterium sp. TaxID=239 RepID=UPI0033404F66